MASEISRIAVNTGAIHHSSDGNPKGTEIAQQEVKPEQAAVAPQSQQIAPGDVLSLMAQHAVVQKPKTYNIEKYVNPEQAARIAAMMGNFESAVAKGLKAIEEEGLILSDQAAHALAASMVE